MLLNWDDVDWLFDFMTCQSVMYYLMFSVGHIVSIEQANQQ